MVAQAGFNTTTNNDTVLASNVAQFAVPSPMAMPIYEVISMQHNCSAINSNVLDIPSWDAPPATETTTEADEVVSANYATSKKSITGGMLSTRALVSDQLQQDSVLMQSERINQMVRNIRKTIDQETLGLFVGATNVSDHTGVNLTLELWRTALAAFRAQEPLGQVCFIGSHNQLRDIIKDMAIAAGGQQLGDAGRSIFDSMIIDGYRGPYQGVSIFESGNIQEADASNDNGGFLAVTGSGPNSPPSLSGFSLGVWRGIQAAGVYVPARHGYDSVVSARVGFQRTAEYLVRGLISKKAA